MQVQHITQYYLHVLLNSICDILFQITRELFKHFRFHDLRMQRYIVKGFFLKKAQEIFLLSYNLTLKTRRTSNDL